ncbi:MAG: nucleoside triphosphate pyrophosphohydrolase [candidate division KSB1 bacterium]|nr:nucleoside triphosphate pyrophosphohydrolase [candidate division KSB1 bacterium]
MNTVLKKFEKLLDIMNTLRSPGGCPWDREQTHASLSRHSLEEVYEVIEAIESQDVKALPGELGDLLLQVVFHAQIGREIGSFDMEDVLDAINDKLIRRHPHVFGDETIETSEEQTRAWEQSKMKREGKKSAIDGVPRQLPALLRAHRMQGKAQAVGFDWPTIHPVWDKAHEELDELKQVCEENDADKMQDELGDVLFSIVNLSRFIRIEPEEALRRACDKFERRFKAVEKEFAQRGRAMSDAPLEELDAVWEQVKEAERREKD